MTDTQRILDQSLLNAARINDITLVKQLLRKRASINAKDMHGKTPMHYAAAYGNTDLVKLLWENGARVDAEDDVGNTPLHCAITFREDEREVINMLCDYGAKVNAQNKLGQTPLRLSVRRQNIQAFETLLERGADVTLKDTYGDTVLHCISSIANSCSHKETAKIDKAIQLLLAKKADINARDNEERTPLHRAIWSAYPSRHRSVELLVKYGADVNIQDNNGDTPLHFALRLRNFIAAMFILNGDCDVSIKNKQGDTVFDLLEECKQEKRIDAEDYSKIMQRLLEKQKKTAPHQINLMAQQREGRSRE